MVRIRPANQQPPARVLVLIHGWTGDERSMEIFTRELPADYLLLFPRGPVQAPGGGFGWAGKDEEGLARYLDLVPTASKLFTEIDLRLADLGLERLPLSLAGFSQGAAMAYTMAILNPQRVERTAALAGFLPAIPLSLDSSGLRGKSFFIAHGTRDETIPVEKAHKAVRFLQDAGAVVDYCESTAGHKLAVSCFNNLAKFLTA
jgi:phospholipase/carboxylesterase